MRRGRNGELLQALYLGQSHRAHAALPDILEGQPDHRLLYGEVSTTPIYLLSVILVPVHLEHLIGDKHSKALQVPRTFLSRSITFYVGINIKKM